VPAEDPLDSETVAGEPRDGRLTTREPWAVVALVAVAWFVVFGGRFVLPAFGVQIQESLDMTNREFGIAITVLWACYSTMQFPSGVLSDDLGYRPVLVGGSLLMGIGFAALSGVWTFVAFVLVAAVIGIATGLMTTPMLSLVSELFSDRKGRALGVVGASGDASGVVAPLAATAILLVATWHVTFIALGAVGVVLGVAFHVVLVGPDAFERPAIRSRIRRSGGELRRSGVPALLLLYSVYAFTWQGLAAFIPLYAFQTKGLPQSEANALLSLFFLAGVVVKPATGWLSDIAPRRLLASASMALAGVALATLTTVDAPIGVFALFAVCGTFLMAFPPVMQAYLMDLFAGDEMGGAFGLSRTTFILVGSTGPAAIGIGSDVASFDAVFVALGAGLFVSGGLLLVTMQYIGGR
jgi:predicted MFS family arabinose efflux permease